MSFLYTCAASKRDGGGGGGGGPVVGRIISFHCRKSVGRGSTIYTADGRAPGNTPTVYDYKTFNWTTTTTVFVTNDYGREMCDHFYCPAVAFESIPYVVSGVHTRVYVCPGIDRINGVLITLIDTDITWPRPLRT